MTNALPQRIKKQHTHDNYSDKQRSLHNDVLLRMQGFIDKRITRINFSCLMPTTDIPMDKVETLESPVEDEDKQISHRGNAMWRVIGGNPSHQGERKQRDRTRAQGQDREDVRYASGGSHASSKVDENHLLTVELEARCKRSKGARE